MLRIHSSCCTWLLAAGETTCTGRGRPGDLGQAKPNTVGFKPYAAARMGRTACSRLTRAFLQLCAFRPDHDPRGDALESVRSHDLSHKT